MKDCFFNSYESPSFGIFTVMTPERILSGSPIDQTVTNDDYSEETFNW